jgi:hypothetical protein
MTCPHLIQAHDEFVFLLDDEGKVLVVVVGGVEEL